MQKKSIIVSLVVSILPLFSMAAGQATIEKLNSVDRATAMISAEQYRENQSEIRRLQNRSKAAAETLTHKFMQLMISHPWSKSLGDDMGLGHAKVHESIFIMSNKHQLLRRIIQTELNEYALLLIDRGASSDDVLNVLSTKPTWILKSYDDQEMQRLSKKLAAAISENQSTDDQSQREFIRHVDAVLRELCDGV